MHGLSRFVSFASYQAAFLVGARNVHIWQGLAQWRSNSTYFHASLDGYHPGRAAGCHMLLLRHHLLFLSNSWNISQPAHCNGQLILYFFHAPVDHK